MKKYLFVFGALAIFFNIGFSQEVEDCQKIAMLVVESINEHSSDKLIEHLSDDFTIAEQDGELARMILSQLLGQLGETVKSQEEISQVQLNGKLELNYKIDFEKKGVKESSFIFDQNNKLLEINLFKIEVKKMCNDTQIEKPIDSIIEVPFKMAGNLILLEVILNDKKRNFFLDTGSPKVILNSKYLQKDSLQKTISSVKGVNGSISDLNIEKMESLDFNGIQITNQDVLTLDMAHLEKDLGCEIYGLIGYDLIKDYDLILDYENHRLTLINPEGLENYKNENFMQNKLETISFELAGHTPVVEATIHGEKIKFGIDTGAESNLLAESFFKGFEKVLSNIKTDELIGGSKLAKEVKEGEINKMELGGKMYKNVLTTFSDISHLDTHYDGLIGYPILSQQKTIISFSRKELTFVN